VVVSGREGNFVVGREKCLCSKAIFLEACTVASGNVIAVGAPVV
jgi:hypothetical protein